MAQQETQRLKRDLTVASVLFATGIVVCILSLAQIRAENRSRVAQEMAQEMAQATQPLQGTTSPEDQSRTPAESKPGGERPTTPAPEPARPDPQTQGAARPALPQAPAEKMAPPIKDK
jgi:hypothetical protein